VLSEYNPFTYSSFLLDVGILTHPLSPRAGRGAYQRCCQATPKRS
jgi:hypothetical protein